MTGISITIGDTAVTVEGGPDDSLQDVSNAANAQLQYLTEHHPALIVDIGGSIDV